MPTGHRALVRKAELVDEHRDEIRCAVELRQDDSRTSPGRLYGVLITYGERAADRPEAFAPDSLSWPDDGIVIREQHNRQAPIVRVVPEVRGRQVVIDHPLPDTQRGRDAATMIRDGTLKGLSVEFRSRRENRAKGYREITDGLLRGAGLVDDPSYAGSVVEVREREAGAPRVGRTLWL